MPGSWIFLGTLVLAVLVGGALPSERARMIAALVLLAAVLVEHLVLRQAAAGAGLSVSGGLIFVSVMALAFGLALGVGIRLVAHAVRSGQFSRVALATLVTLILDVGIAVVGLP